MKKYEILKPGDMVMKIVGPRADGVWFNDVANDDVPNGSCGIVLAGEGMLQYCDHMQQTREGYGCYVDFPHHPAWNNSGWFLLRQRLMKITPDGELDSEESSKTKKLNIPYLTQNELDEIIREKQQKELQRAYERLVKEYENGQSD